MILLMNLFANLVDSAIPSDNVDEDVLMKPRKLDIDYIRKFMLIMGPVSALMDVTIFLVVSFLIIGGNPLNFTPDQQSILQTALFTEMLLTEILVIFVLRAPRATLSQNKPSTALIFSNLVIAGVAIALPYVPFVGTVIFQFHVLPLIFYLYLAVIIIGYLIIFYYVRRWYFRKNAYLLEQASFEKTGIMREDGNHGSGDNLPRNGNPWVEGKREKRFLLE